MQNGKAKHSHFLMSCTTRRWSKFVTRFPFTCKKPFNVALASQKSINQYQCKQKHVTSLHNSVVP